ncbi:TonB family protein [Thermodesulfobacteriota bacterium]
MRRLLLAALLALFLHGAFLVLKVGRAEQNSARFSRPEPISLALVYKYPQRIASPVRKRPEKVEKRIALPERPQKKITAPEKREPVPEPYSTGPDPATENPVKDIVEPFREEEENIDSEEMESSSISTIRSIDAYIPENVIDETQSSTPLPLQIAVPVRKKRPKYPRAARRRGYEGTVVLKALIDTGGGVKDLNILESSGHGILDRAAEDSVRKWLFEPWMKGNEPVEMWGKVIVRFELK